MKGELDSGDLIHPLSNEQNGSLVVLIVFWGDEIPSYVGLYPVMLGFHEPSTNDHY